jgi:16S rRNA (guanine527-N7)-methyltransferase
MNPGDPMSSGSGPRSDLVDPLLLLSLEESQRLGFLGRRAIEEVVAHARYFVGAVSQADVVDGGSVLDLGAGGGLPGLVIAHDLPTAHVTLLDRRVTRTDFLARVVRRLRWTGRVDVVTQDAARPSAVQRAAFDAVVARGFGPPETTLRLAREWVRPGGLVVISEPPTGDRWASADLGRLNVERIASDPHVAVFEVR